MTAHDCRSELLVAARRGRLSEAGRIALDAHLAGCASCRSSFEVSADFDAADAIDLHDATRIRALADLARHRVGRRDGSVFAGARAMAAAAAMIILGGSASAAVWWWRRPLPSPTIAVSAPVGRPIEPDGRPRAASPAATPHPEAAVVRPRPLRPADRFVALARPIDLPSAAAILRQATEARQRGERTRAADLYRRLKREFPASPEAVLSTVPLGDLLLDDGLPRAALAEFDVYLAKMHGGALIPEALYGRARALGRLGDREEERRVWTRLCADFPDSAYAQLGRHRLAEIE